MRSEAALSAMRDAVALWQVGSHSAADIVNAACDLLVVGVDGPELRTLAAVSVRVAREDSYQVEKLLDLAMAELGLDYHPRESTAAQETALKAMAARTLEARMSPRDLAAWAHGTFNHDGIELAQPLVELDDVYDVIEYGDMTVEDVDADVLTEAKRLTSPS